MTIPLQTYGVVSRTLEDDVPVKSDCDVIKALALHFPEIAVLRGNSGNTINLKRVYEVLMPIFTGET